MAVTFRATTARSATPAEPTGSAQDDIILAIASTETGSPTIGVATGFTEIDWGVEVEISGVTCRIYWARRGAGALATNWTGDYMIALIGYSGAKTSGSPINANAKSTLTGGSMSPYPSVTTTADNCMIVGLSGQWNWGATAPNAWANERYDPSSDIWIGDDGLFVTAGATGTIASTPSGSYGVLFTVAIEPDGGGGGGDPEMQVIRGGKLLHGGMLLKGIVR